MDHSLFNVVHAHDAGFVLVAALVCSIGAALTVVLLIRSKALQRRRLHLHVALGAMIAGTTIWATHFIAMLGYDPAGTLAYEPVLTGVTLVVAVAGCSVAVMAAGLPRNRWPVLSGGVAFGLTVTTMHYLGMQALQVPGRFEWHWPLVMTSVVLGCGFGVIMAHRILRPLTRYCWLGGTLAMILAVCTMHFVGMAAVIFVPDASVIVPEKLISNFVLGFVVLVVVSLLLLIGFTTFVIETEMSADNQRRLSDAVRRDLLTGLPNRAGFAEYMDLQQHQLDKGSVARMAVFTIDLNLFKQVNDTVGHAGGDRVLCHVADQMKNVLKDGEYVARVGGDEFAAIKSDVATNDVASAFAKRLCDAIQTPVDFEGAVLTVGVSIGIAQSPEDGRNLMELLQFSDMAMYRAKRDPLADIQFYDNEIETAHREKLAMLADLRDAIANDQLFLNYQFQNDLMTREVIGFEVLLRWLHPVRGLISPAVFIPLAEDAGLINEIGLWVMRTACFEAATWDMPYPIAVNVSPQQLTDPAFVTLVADVLTRSNLAPTRLEVEITEATIIHDEGNAMAMMHQLKSMGIRIAMDDFGTGYSSLSTLRVFPFDKIKIDRSFVHNVHESRQNAAIVRATLLLGVALDVPVLAEGAETLEEIGFLTDQSCNAVQGYFFGKPMPVADVRQITMVQNAARTAG